MTNNDQQYHSIISAMLGDPTVFFDDYWRKRPLYVSGAAPQLVEHYSVGQFLRDMASTQPLPYRAVCARDGNRFFTKHMTPEDLHNGVLAGGVSAIKASKTWHRESPESWSWMRLLFGALCQRVSMTYMTPARSEDVDIFLAGPHSELGTHFDTTDVFTIQLVGERKWTVDSELQLDKVLDVARGQDWYPAKEISFQAPTCDYILSPGDSLYVPAYSVHRVTGVSWSVSLSLGLRAFNEIDFLEHLLEQYRMSHYLSFGPVPSYAESARTGHPEAKLAIMARLRSLFLKLEGAAFATLLLPPQFPPSFGDCGLLDNSQPLPGVFKSGFALEEGSH